MDTSQRDTPAAESYIGYARDTALIAVAQVMVALLQFLRLPILTKWLGVELYGTWSIIWVTVVLTTSLAILGLNMAMVRFLAAEKDISRIRQGFLSAVVTVLGAGLLCTLVLVLCSEFIATSLLGDKNASQLVQLSSLMILTQALSCMGIAFLQTFRQMKWYSGLMVGKAAAELALMACFLMLGWELTGLVIAVLASDVLCFAIAFFIALRQVGFQLPGFAHLGSYLKYGLPLVPTSVLSWVVHSSDRYIIGYFMEPKDVGIYAAAYALASITSLFLGPLQVVLLPTVSKAYDARDITVTRTYLKYSLKYLFALSIPAAFGLSVLAAPLLRILTTTEFIAGSTVVPFLALGMVFHGLYAVCLYIVLLVKKTYLSPIILGISAVLNIGLNLVLIPVMGILGAAVATLVAYFALGMLALFLSYRYLKFDIGLPFILKSLFASAVMASAIWLLSPSSLAQVIMCVFAGIVVYSILLLALRGFNKAELNLFKELVLKFNIKR
jgi:O-antigen/teichoic acid export membrane protein